MIERFVASLDEVDRTQLAACRRQGSEPGGAVAVEGVRVPAGFCVTSDAFFHVVAGVPTFDELLHRLSSVHPADRGAIQALSAEIRSTIEAMSMPADLVDAITRALARVGDRAAYAVAPARPPRTCRRPSSRPAGQVPDTCGVGADPRTSCGAGRRCSPSVRSPTGCGTASTIALSRWRWWSSGWSSPTLPGILFTADPLSVNRRVASIEAGFGLGEALVSGQVNADTYKVRDGQVIDRRSAPRSSSRAMSGGGTEQQAVEPSRQAQPALTDDQVVGWCASAEGSRHTSAAPRTSSGASSTTASTSSRAGRSRRCSRSPRPPTMGTHVYVSVGHQQMMTDAMKPLGLSFWNMTAARPMFEAGGGSSSTSPGPGARRRPRTDSCAAREIRSVGPRRPGDRRRTRRLRPELFPDDGRGQSARRRSAGAARDRPGDRRPS